MSNNYEKLQKVEDYDQEAVEELAEAMMEKRQVEARLSFLDELLSENEELRQFVWTTRDGTSIPLHKITDDHMTNIVRYIASMGRQIPKAIKAEARKRNIALPDPMAIEIQAVKRVFELDAPDDSEFGF